MEFAILCLCVGTLLVNYLPIIFSKSRTKEIQVDATKEAKEPQIVEKFTWSIKLSIKESDGG